MKRFKLKHIGYIIGALLLFHISLAAHSQKKSNTIGKSIDFIASIEREDFQLHSITIHFPFCECYVWPCQHCDDFPDDPLNGPNHTIAKSDVVILDSLNMKDENGRSLYLMRIKHVDPKISQNANNFRWIGAAHNALLDLILPNIQKVLIIWRGTNHKPSDDEILLLVQHCVRLGLRDFGFKGKQLSEMSKLSDQISSAIIASKLKLKSVSNEIVYKQSPAYNSRSTAWAYFEKIEHQINVGDSALSLLPIFSKNYNTISASRFNFQDFITIAAANSVAEKSTIYWDMNLDKLKSGVGPNSGAQPTSNSVAKERDWRDLVKEDAKGAMMGAIVGSIIPGPGTITGAITGAATGSTVEAVGQFVDWFWGL